MNPSRTRRRRRTGPPPGAKRDRQFREKYEYARATNGPYPDIPRVNRNGNSWWEWPLVALVPLVLGGLVWHWRGIVMAIILIVITALVLRMRTLLGTILVLVIGLLVLWLFVLVAFNANPL